MDYKCNLDCPVKTKPPYCCQWCRISRLYFVNDNNKHLWNTTDGFWSENGCRLSRENMPKECKDYDCRKYRFVTSMIWISGKWQVVEEMEIPPGKKIRIVDIT